MTINKSNTKLKKKKVLTIEQILEFREDNKEYDEEDKIELRLYRDIIEFFINLDGEKSVKQEDRSVKLDELDEKPSVIYEIDEIRFREVFRSRALCNWLLSHNRDLILEFADSRIAKTYRAHTIDARISKRIEKLVNLGLVMVDDDKVDSERGKSKTHQYIVSRNGMVVASLLNLQKLTKDSTRYKKNLQFILNRFMEFIPHTYRKPDNYYYYFLKEILQNCFNQHQDILFYFFNLMLQYQSGLLINFSVIRSKLNTLFFRNIIKDKDFRLAFYNSLREFNTSFWIRALKDKSIETLIYEEKSKAQQLIRTQFKLDIESQIDKDISEVLKTDTYMTKSFQFSTKVQKHFTERDIIKKGLFEQIQQQCVLDYPIRNNWELKRNSNLLDSNSITIITKCQRCGFISPYSIELETEAIEQVICQQCKERGGIESYDFINEMNHIFGLAD
jgi:hypothetical protein